ncbi:MAG: DUF4976 domain-containing protein, partial [Planctomycetota bacterium]|nr:DUF4976 domain-containing protein [Planctomycetota bacterium]
YPHTPTIHAVRSERFKYIRYHGLWDTNELYDLQTDPAEEKNLAAEQPKVVARMNRHLLDWQSSVLNSLREKDYREVP